MRVGGSGGGWSSKVITMQGPARNDGGSADWRRGGHAGHRWVRVGMGVGVGVGMGMGMGMGMGNRDPCP